MFKWAWISISLFLVILLSAPTLAERPSRDQGSRYQGSRTQESRENTRRPEIGRQSGRRSDTTRRTPSRESNYSRPERRESGRDNNLFNRLGRNRDNESRRDNGFFGRKEESHGLNWGRIDRDYYRSEKYNRTYHYVPPPVVYSYPKTYHPDYPSERYYPSYRHKSYNTGLSWLKLAIVIAITCESQSVQRYKCCSNRDDALSRCQSDKGSVYRNYFYTEPYARPWWIPEYTEYDGFSVRPFYDPVHKSYGSWDPEIQSIWRSYNPFNDPVVADKILSAEGYRY